MKKMLERVFSFLRLKTTRLPAQKKWHKTRAQSLVEFAITLPIILILLSGVVEFGFALNYYLSLLDATREAARFFSDQDPFTRDGGGAITGDDNNFYASAATMVRASPGPAGGGPLRTRAQNRPRSRYGRCYRPCL
ncbi:MAG: hypothetical protein HND47_17015 [Chloroflexi bacterium]|nr:hypothetical protein [Chloroflexota bacterium]